MTLRWHIAYTNPRQEVRVQRDLESRGILAYVPMETRQVEVHRFGVRVADVQRPLFPRYVLLGLSEGQGLDKLDGRTMGGSGREKLTGGLRIGDSVPIDFGVGPKVVSGLVGILRKPSGEPVVLPAKVVSDLQFAEVAGMFDLRPRAVVYQPGQRVKVVAGPLADRVARIVAAPPTGRIHVLMEMFGGQVTAQVDAGQLRPILDTDQPHP